MFRPGDIIEAVKAIETEHEIIRKDARREVADVSASGLFIRLKDHSAFIRAYNFRKAS